MIWPHNECQLIFSKRFNLQVRAMGGSFNQGNSYLMAGQSLKDFSRAAAHNMNSQFGPFAQKYRKKLWQEIDGNCMGSSNAQLSAFLPSERSKCGNCVVGDRLDLSNIFQQRYSGWREAGIAANAIEESDSKTLFERPYLSRYSGLRQMKLGCGPSIIQHVRDDPEHLQFEVLNHGVAPVW
jgi:hypothetical protein